MKQYLAWIDMEMTGLDFQKNRILEAAIIITDFNFKTLVQKDFIIFQNDSELNKMDEWCLNHHTKSGLLSKIKSGKKEQEVEQKFIEICQPYLTENKIVIAGNSISQDKKFIERWWPEFSKLLHYRVLDVSSFKIIFENKWNKKFEKKKNHRALDDIQESIGELKFYLDFVRS